MTEITLTCKGGIARAKATDYITAGMVGIRVAVIVDPDFDGLTLRGFARCKGVERSFMLDSRKEGTLPWECCVGGGKLEVGVDGVAEDGSIRIPTKWADIGMVLNSVAESSAQEGSPPPTPTEVEQITMLANGAYQAAESVRQDADEGKFNGKPAIIGENGNWYIWTVDRYVDSGVSARGDVDDEKLAQFVEDYMQRHPVHVPVTSVNGQTGDVEIEIPPDMSESVAWIEALIPEQATAENELADKEFVNSSVASNTAYYISKDGEPFESLEELEAYTGTLTNNDYAFVVSTDASGNVVYTRYKWNTQSWAEEFKLNNSSFTAAQWAAISSGITALLVTSFNTHIGSRNNPHEVSYAQLKGTKPAYTAAEVGAYTKTETDNKIDLSRQAIEQAIAAKMQFYKVTAQGSPLHIVSPDGQTMNYSDVVAKYNDDRYFLYAEYANLTFIPTLPPMDDPSHGGAAMEFVCTWIYEGKLNVSRLIINEQNAVKYETVEAAQESEVTQIKGDLSGLDDRVTALEEGGGGGGEGWTVRQINQLKSVLYMMEFSTEELAAEGRMRIDSLIASLKGQKILNTISAVYNGDAVPAGTLPESLRDYIEVTGYYSDGSESAITDYLIAGEITEGENTIEVYYQGKTATFTVMGMADSGYVLDGLILNIDAIDNVDDVPVDQTGNYAITLGAKLIKKYPTYFSMYRGQCKIEDTSILSAMGNSWTVEMAWQNRTMNGDPPAPEDIRLLTGGMFSYNNGKHFLEASGKYKIPTNNTTYGTANEDRDVIIHATVTYDNGVYKLYREGQEAYSMNTTIDMTAGAFLEFWGNIGWASPTFCSANAARVYNRCLTADEIASNYDVDILRFGTQNVAAAS